MTGATQENARLPQFPFGARSSCILLGGGPRSRCPATKLSPAGSAHAQRTWPRATDKHHTVGGTEPCPEEDEALLLGTAVGHAECYQGCRNISELSLLLRVDAASWWWAAFSCLSGTFDAVGSGSCHGCSGTSPLPGAHTQQMLLVGALHRTVFCAQHVQQPRAAPRLSGAFVLVLGGGQ